VQRCKTVPSCWRCCRLLLQLYQAVPQVLLPVIPHMTSEMLAEDAVKREEATRLVCQLFSVPGNRLVCEYADVFDELLHRFKDAEVGWGCIACCWCTVHAAG
jgi:hypothetical protein